MPARNPNYAIRFATPAERDALQDLQRRAGLATPDYREHIITHPDAIEIAPELFLTRRVRLVADADRIVGFSILLEPQDGAAELDGLFVEPEFFGHAIGRSLILDACATAHAEQASRIEVTANPRAIGFYERLGFRGIAMVQTRFAPALRMRLGLAGGRASEALPHELWSERLSLRRVYFRDFELIRRDVASFLRSWDAAVGEGFAIPLQPPERDPPVAIEWDSFWLIHREMRVVIGACGARKFPNEAGEVEIGYGLSPAFEKKGFASEAARRLIQYVFEKPNTTSVTAHTLPEENASTRLLTRCGFERSGTAVDPDEGVVWKWNLRRGAH